MTPTVPPDERISAYLDGDLSAAEHYEVQQLLVGSPEWRAELDEVAWSRVTVRSMPAHVAPVGFFDQLLRDGLKEREPYREPARPKRVRGRPARAARRAARRAAAPEVEPAFIDEPETIDEPMIDEPVAVDEPVFDEQVIDEPVMVEPPPPPAPPLSEPARAPGPPQPAVAFDAPAAPEAGLRRTPQAAPDAPIVTSPSLRWDRPSTQRRDPGEPLWGKPPPRRRATAAPAAPIEPGADEELDASAEVEVASALEPQSEVTAPIPLRPGAHPERARVARWVAAAAAAAALVVAAIFIPSRGSVTPPVPRLADSHSVRSSVSDDPVTQLATISAITPFGR